MSGTLKFTLIVGLVLSAASAPGTLDRATVFRAQEPSRFLLEMGLQDTP